MGGVCEITEITLKAARISVDTIARIMTVLFDFMRFSPFLSVFSAPDKYSPT
jgi:hypothetical protein